MKNKHLKEMVLAEFMDLEEFCEGMDGRRERVEIAWPLVCR